MPFTFLSIVRFLAYVNISRPIFRKVRAAVGAGECRAKTAAKKRGAPETDAPRFARELFLFFLNTGDGLGQLLLAGDVPLPGDHDALGLGRAGAVEGLPFRIEGGDYQLCDGRAGCCGWGCPRRHHQESPKRSEKEEPI